MIVDAIQLSCSKCYALKPVHGFRRRKERSESGKRLGRWSQCIECEKLSAKTDHRRKQANLRTKEFRNRLKQNNYEEYKRRERESNLRKCYGFGDEEYKRLLSLQNGLCAICGEPPTSGRGVKLHIDHDHHTGKVRGLLCGQCNTSLGGFKDSPELLIAAAKYIESKQGTT